MFDMNFEFDNNTLSLNHIDNDYLDFLQFCVQHNFNILIKDVYSSKFIDCLLACQKNGYNNITCVETPNIAPDGLKLKNNIYVLCRKFKVTVENLMSYTFETCMADSDNNPIIETTTKHTVLFNRSRLSDDELDSLTSSGDWKFDSRLIELSEEQLSNLQDKIERD